MSNPFVIGLGKLTQKLARLKGGGSAFPGLVIEKIDPDFAVGFLRQLPYGTVVISGTNGKTTTTKIVTELLESQGVRVFSNSTGSNFMRGVIAALLSRVTLSGKLDADIAILELDEAHAVHFVQRINPRFSLLLNVMRDQLDRFGEIDNTAGLLKQIALNTTDTVIINCEDSRLAAIPQTTELKAKVSWFGLSPQLVDRFPQDDDLYAKTVAPSKKSEASVVLESLQDDCATFNIEGQSCSAALALKGIYNTFNAAAALALVHAILPNAPVKQLVSDLSDIKSAFGRGETFEVDGQVVELLLVKNPGGFRLALESFDATGYDTMIAINDEYADGRDMSWLFDVEFSSLRDHGVRIISGIRAYDMALRLKYDEVPFTEVEIDLDKAMQTLLDDAKRPKRLYCSYTAMLKCRKYLGSRTTVERVL